jgi:hypothetical protein
MQGENMSKVSYLTKLGIFIASVAFVATTVAACGGDDDDTTATGGTTASSGGGGSSANTSQGGSSASTGNTSTAGTSASNCVTSTSCGSAQCSTAGLGTSFLCIKACCTADNKCGSSISLGAFAGLFGGTNTQDTTAACLAQDQPGNENASCPSFMKFMADQMGDAGNMGGNIGQIGGNIQNSPYNYKGCCRPEGVCGFLVSGMKLGCAALTDLEGLFGGFNGGTDTATVAAQKCTP